MDAAQVTANFASWAILPSEGHNPPVPDIVDIGKPVKKFLAKQKKTFDAEGNFLASLFPPDKLPLDDTLDLLPVYLPVAIPLFSGHPNVDGTFNQDGLLDQLASIHPVVALWASCLKEKRFMAPGFRDIKPMRPVCPNGHDNTLATDGDLPVQVVMGGPVRLFYIAVVSDLRWSDPPPAKGSAPTNPARDDVSSDDDSVLVLSTKRKKRSHKRSDNESDDEDAPKFTPFLQMLEILLAVGTVDAQDDLLEVVPPTFSDDLNDATRSASSAKVLARSILNSLQARVHGVERRSRDYLLTNVDLPLISQATTSYLIASQFPMPGPTSLESYKQCFNIFCFCPPPV